MLPFNALALVFPTFKLYDAPEPRIQIYYKPEQRTLATAPWLQLPDQEDWHSMWSFIYSPNLLARHYINSRLLQIHQRGYAHPHEQAMLRSWVLSKLTQPDALTTTHSSKNLLLAIASDSLSIRILIHFPEGSAEIIWQKKKKHEL